MLFIDEAFEAMVFNVSRLEGDQCPKISTMSE